MRRPGAFARAKALFAMIAVIMREVPLAERRERLDRLSPYRSRGKGRGTPSRRYGNKAGKYMPHQGPGEREKRKRNLARGLQDYGSIKLVHQRTA